ncbi:type II secretion system protein [Coraliomargarita parva]|uniref:type II secretion system protein n=1 Tax=Coraliomargarita parva TaxID=3014050 RepID=UPI0022B5E452|nr:type II secretion system protein [Coraliomargarita parva]
MDKHINKPTIHARRFRVVAAKAFTLIELLAVIAVIAILCSILIPLLSSVSGRANEAKSVSNMRQIGVAFGLYLTENSNMPPLPFNEMGGTMENRTLHEWRTPAVGLGFLQYEGFLEMPKGSDVGGTNRSQVFFNPLNENGPKYGNWSDYTYLLSGRYKISNFWDSRIAISADVVGGVGFTPGKPIIGDSATVLYWDGSVGMVPYSVYSEHKNEATGFDR